MRENDVEVAPLFDLIIITMKKAKSWPDADVRALEVGIIMHEAIKPLVDAEDWPAVMTAIENILASALVLTTTESREKIVAMLGDRALAKANSLSDATDALEVKEEDDHIAH